MFQAGKPRHPNAGRKKGTPNKETKSLEQVALDKGVNFWVLLCDVAGDAEHPRQFDAVKEGCSYLYAKRKALEVTAEVDPAILEAFKAMQSLSEGELRKIVAEELRKSK